MLPLRIQKQLWLIEKPMETLALQFPGGIDCSASPLFNG
jgi:hypothetical protein